MKSPEQTVPAAGGPFTKNGWIAPLVAAASAFAVASLGGALTDLGPWYLALKKPWWQPPGVAFPIMWTLIFTLTAIAGVLAWRAAETFAARRASIGLFGVNSVLNVAWSGLFFTLQRPDWALVEAVALWASILALILFIRRLHRGAAGLLLPYILWVSIAVALNYEVARLNGYLPV